MNVEVGDVFEPYLDTALLRLRFIYPRITFTISNPGVLAIENFNVAQKVELVQAINYALYREKIYQDSLPLRHDLMEALFKS